MSTQDDGIWCEASTAHQESKDGNQEPATEVVGPLDGIKSLPFNSEMHLVPRNLSLLIYDCERQKL